MVWRGPAKAEERMMNRKESGGGRKCRVGKKGRSLRGPKNSRAPKGEHRVNSDYGVTYLKAVVI
jgi:hypothetical protein